MKPNSKVLMRWCLGTVIFFVAAYAWFTMQAKPATVDHATAVVTRGAIEDSISALGSLQPREFLDVGTQVSGQLKKVLVAIGDAVEKGKLVAEIDPVVFSAKVEAGEATLLTLDAQLEEKSAQKTLLTRQYERNALMFKQNAVSQDVLETSLAARRANTAQISTLLAQQQQTKAILKVEQANLKYTKIYSPIAGTVVALVARQGQTLNASQQAPIILRIADLDTMTVVTQVSEADVVRLKPGIPVYFSTLGRPDRRWKSKVRQILPTPETINNVVLYHVLFDVDNSDRELKTQMSAQVFFVLDKAKDTLLVPVAALKPHTSSGSRKSKAETIKSTDSVAAMAANDKAELDGPAQDASPEEMRKLGYSVRVLRAGKLETREVMIGIMNRLSAQVLSGLAEGDEVVLEDAAPESKKDRKNPSKRPAKL
jgi:membrane fusion protein, macrolide-specific efflux system